MAGTYLLYMVVFVAAARDLNPVVVKTKAPNVKSHITEGEALDSVRATAVDSKDKKEC